MGERFRDRVPVRNEEAGSCRRIVVGINSDRAVKELKGEDRPVNGEQDRLNLVQSIRWVDEAFIFDSTQNIDALEQVSPDILVKGGEWTADEVRGRDGVSDDIEIKICPLFKDHSTTNTMKKVKEWQKKS